MGHALLALLLDLICHQNTRNTSSDRQNLELPVLWITERNVWNLIALSLFRRCMKAKLRDVWRHAEELIALLVKKRMG
jgi:hypothetical protein